MGKRNEIEAALQSISARGIQADSRRLKDDMIRQWDDHRLFVREYAANSCDARARVCQVYGNEKGDLQTIVIEDDGLGMDRRGVIDFMKVFRSNKPNADRPVGQHGIGRLSAAANPDLVSFAMLTSDGREMWQLTTTSLLGDVPMTLKRVEPVGPHGTRFELTYKKRRSLREELHELRAILETYVRFLPMNIVVFVPERDDPGATAQPHFVHGEWNRPGERFVRSYEFELDGRSYELILGLGADKHEVYQNRVLITATRYNLLCHDLTPAFRVPHLTIRVDSQDFQVPFGRHCLRNEQQVLPRLARHIRERVLPQYFAELHQAYELGTLKDYGVSPGEVEDMACALMRFDPSAERLWSRLPVFATRNWGRVSLVMLDKYVRSRKSLYIADENVGEGVDYSVFDVPVLSQQQPLGGMDVLNTLFRHSLLNLSAEDTVLEAPAGVGPTPGPREKRLERHLRFSPDAAQRAYRRSAAKDRGRSRRRAQDSIEDLQRLAGVCQEAVLAMQDITLEWRVNYLVGRDGRTPCDTHRFLLKNNQVVVLNLYHPDIRDLVSLADRNAPLAGHFGLALCLTEDGRLLKHLTPEAREDLLVADAVAKCGARDEPEIADSTPPNEASGWVEFLRDAEDEEYGLF
jgi:hypothetical protein